uniref:Threonine dehydratase n=1 Tax=Kalanchoe fedtschenkoi TaxID=63787 RepID=A0A7N0TBQ6_KALFE
MEALINFPNPNPSSLLRRKLPTPATPSLKFTPIDPFHLKHGKKLGRTASICATAAKSVVDQATPSIVADTSAASPSLPRVSPASLQYPAGYLGVQRKGLESSEESEESVNNALEYLTRILASKVYDVADESPLELAQKLSERLGVHMFLKREDLQQVFSFKLRGAYNMMQKIPKEQLDRGVICSSAGNHAQGVALAARKLGCDAVIVMPVTTPDIKWQSVKRLGATVVLQGDSYDEAQAYAKQRGEKDGRTFVPPFDHPDVIAGQGTVGMEIYRQANGKPLHAVFVPVGGGGLIAGIAAYMKRVSPEVKIIGVEPSDANAMALSLHHGQRVMLDQVGGFADGVAVKTVGEETFRLCKELMDGVVLVSRDAICASIKDMFEEKRSILEPAGALALAGAEAYCKYYGLKGVNVVAITSGANMNFNRLRLVTELADVGRQQEAVLATTMPETPGSFKRFAEMVGPINITEFKYRYKTGEEEALVLYSVGVHTPNELKAMLERMKLAQLKTKNHTANDLVKDHLRHLVRTK